MSLGHYIFVFSTTCFILSLYDLFLLLSLTAGSQLSLSSTLGSCELLRKSPEESAPSPSWSGHLGSLEPDKTFWKAAVISLQVWCMLNKNGLYISKGISGPNGEGAASAQPPPEVSLLVTLGFLLRGEGGRNCRGRGGSIKFVKNLPIQKSKGRNYGRQKHSLDLLWRLIRDNLTQVMTFLKFLPVERSTWLKTWGQGGFKGHLCSMPRIPSNSCLL